MSTSLNATGNILYDTITLDRGGLAQGAIYPEEDGKADLGSSTKKFDNLYVNNIPSQSGDITEGTWTPSLNWSGLTPSAREPTLQNIEAGFQKAGNRVWCFCVFSITYYGSNYISSPLGGLPFKIHQRGAALAGSAYRLGNYSNVPIFYMGNTYDLFLNVSDLSRRSVAALYYAGDPVNVPTFFIKITSGSTRTSYYYAKFNYRTE